MALAEEFADPSHSQLGGEGVLCYGRVVLFGDPALLARIREALADQRPPPPAWPLARHQHRHQRTTGPWLTAASPPADQADGGGGAPSAS